jgi:hypothetical protein
LADIVWATVTLPGGFVGEAYEAGLAFTGNATAVTASAVVTGALPPGLSLDATSKVRITGTPTATGIYTFTLSLTDTAGTVNSGSFTIIVGNRSPLDILLQPPAVQVARNLI